MFSAATKTGSVAPVSTGIVNSFLALGNNGIVRNGSSTGSRRIFTSSFWFKRVLFPSPTGDTYLWVNGTLSPLNYFRVMLDDGDVLKVENTVSGTITTLRTTSQVFRDPAAWYHLVISVDTEQANSDNRLRMYLNGVQITSFSTSAIISRNADLQINHDNDFRYGANLAGGERAECLLADVKFIDGQALDATSFGEFDSVTGAWKAKEFTGSYGTQGHWLTFTDTSTSGKDYSGNNNNFSNVSSTLFERDVPTDNFAALNPFDLRSADGTSGSVSKNNRLWRATTSTSTGSGVGATIPVNSPAGGKYYWEVTLVSGVTTATNAVGVGLLGPTPTDSVTQIHVLYSSTSPTYTNGDILGFAFDQGAGTLAIYKNNTLATTLTGITQTTTPLFPAIRDNITTAVVADFNFGQQAFTYTPPSGFTTLSTANLAAPSVVKSTDGFNTLLYTGTGSSRSVSGLSFTPDLVWIKKRNSSTNGNHQLYDAVRGTTRFINSDLTTDEGTNAQSLTAFNSDGFTVGTSSFVNGSGDTYAAWCWDEAAADGFDIVTYTGNGSNRTIAHSLGVAPDMMLIKARTTAGTDQGWAIYHSGLGAPTTSFLQFADAAVTTGSTSMWNSTAPTSSVFTVGTNARVNTNNDTYVAYLFANVPGFSLFDTYVGNGNTNGPFVWCGFRPALLLVKRIGTVDGWYMVDSKRSAINPTNHLLQPNKADAEFAASGNANADFLSTGFKLRETGAGFNNNGSSYVFAAFAEVPFKYALAR